jgi:hypothetical protein
LTSSSPRSAFLFFCRRLDDAEAGLIFSCSSGSHRAGIAQSLDKLSFWFAVDEAEL